MGLELSDSKRVLIGEEAIMHLPELVLVAGTLNGLSRFERKGMNGFQRIVEEYVLQFAAIDILFRNLCERPTDVSAAKRSLVIGELHQRQARGSITLEGVVANIQNELSGRRGGRGSGSGRLSRPQKILDFLKLLLNRLLAFLEGFDLFFEFVHLAAGSCLSRHRNPEPENQHTQLKNTPTLFYHRLLIIL